MPVPRFARHGVVVALGVSILALALPASAQNLGIRDVPLTPWTGFARQWDWTYDALHRLVLSGIAGKVVMNTKPMSRREMALLLADVVRRVQANAVGDFDHRSDLQDTLLALMEEFGPELTALGVTGHGIQGEAPRLIEIRPLRYVKVGAGGASEAATDLENRHGERLDKGWNARLETASWAEAGGIAAAYLHPQFRAGKETLDARLVEGYLKARAGFAELVVGRESLWWGPGFHGSMILSNNALGLDMVRLQTAHQVTLPWLLRYLGPVKALAFFGQFEREREFPRAKLAGVRVNLAPFSWLELGGARTIMFGGEGRPDIEFYEYPRVFFQGNREGEENSKYAGNNLSQIDVTLRLADVGKYIHLTRDAELYLDFGWDDTCCGTFYTPLRPGAIVGLYLPNLFLSPDTTFRVEYANTSSFNFTHSTWTDGYGRKGRPLAHFVGSAAEDLFFRYTHRMYPNLEVGVELDIARRGTTLIGQQSETKELYRHFGVDVSYRHSPQLSLGLLGRVEWVRNRDFVASDTEVNFVSMLEATYAFDRGPGAGARTVRPLPPRPEPPPPTEQAPDPEEVLSWQYGRRLVSDSWRILTAPTRWGAREWLVAGGIGAAVGGTMLLDHEIRSLVQRNRSEAGDTAADVLKYFGHAVPAGIIGLSYVGGQITGNVTAKRIAADGLEASLISNALFVYPLKFVAGRARPEEGKGAQDYDPFHFGSLPSFHTTEAFAVASVVSEHLDHPALSLLAYGLAGGVGLSRINDDRHWASDVLLSAAIGTVVGKAVVALNRERRASSVSLVPLMAPGAWGAALSYRY
ncbi:MAG: capsule assembly Wzi family protein [Candidatus Methylomirabilales bacterium]